MKLFTKSPRCSSRALGSVFGLKSEMVERQEMRGGEGRQWVHTHTHSLTHGQAGNTRHIWAGCCPASWLVSRPQSWPLIGCRLRCVTSVLLCIPWHWHQIQSPSSFTQPIPGCRPGQQVAETPETGFCYQLYSGLLTAVSALIVVTGLQTVIDWILDAPRKHSVQWSASWAASDPGPIVSVS